MEYGDKADDEAGDNGIGGHGKVLYEMVMEFSLAAEPIYLIVAPILTVEPIF